MAPIRRSALESFACPANYRDKYEDGLEDSSAPAQRGIAFHDCAALYIHKLVAANQDADPMLAHEALEEGLRLRPMAWELQQEVRHQIWPRHVERFRLNLDAFVLAEERQSDGVTTWQPDLVYAFPEALEIVDWKTFYVTISEEEARDAFQSKFYLWRAMHVWPGFERYRIRYVFPRLGTETVVEFTPGELDGFRDQVQVLLDQIAQARATNEWPEIPGLHCRYCVRRCSIADDPRRMPLRLLTAGDAEAALLKATALRRQAEQLVEALKGFCEVHGEVAANGISARYDAVTRRRWDLVDVIDVLAESGVDDLSTLPQMLLTASTLRPLLKVKARAAIGLALDARADVKHRSSFTMTKPKRPDAAVDDEEEAEVGVPA